MLSYLGWSGSNAEATEESGAKKEEKSFAEEESDDDDGGEENEEDDNDYVGDDGDDDGDSDESESDEDSVGVRSGDDDDDESGEGGQAVDDGQQVDKGVSASAVQPMKKKVTPISPKESRTFKKVAEVGSSKERNIVSHSMMIPQARFARSPRRPSGWNRSSSPSKRWRTAPRLS